MWEIIIYCIQKAEQRRQIEQWRKAKQRRKELCPFYGNSDVRYKINPTMFAIPRKNSDVNVRDLLVSIYKWTWISAIASDTHIILFSFTRLKLSSVPLLRKCAALKTITHFSFTVIGFTFILFPDDCFFTVSFPQLTSLVYCTASPETF